MSVSRKASRKSLKIPYFLKKFVKIRQVLEVPPPDASWLPTDGGGFCTQIPLPRAILPTLTVLLQNLLSLLLFLMKV